ncbi:hypothetical protein D9M68_587990 [compost metagenome]
MQAAGLPVAPTVGLGQFLGHALGQLVGVLPLAEAQQQAGAPLADGVVAQFGVVLGHHLEGAGIETLGQGQADLAGNGHFLALGEGQAGGVDVQQAQGLLRLLARQAAQAEADGIGHVPVGGDEAAGLAEQLGLLRHLHHELSLGAQARHGLHQVFGQAIVAGLRGQLGAFPAQLLGQLALRAPHAEEHVAGFRLRLAHQPELLRRGVAFGLHAVLELVLAEQAVQFGEVELGVVVVGEGLPFAALGEPAQPAQLHPARLGQVAVFGEELLDLFVARPFQTGGQLVVGEIGLQRIVAQGIGIAAVGAGIALGQGALGLVVHRSLLCERRRGGLGGFQADRGKEQAGKQAEQTTAHDTSGGRYIVVDAPIGHRIAPSLAVSQGR